MFIYVRYYIMQYACHIGLDLASCVAESVKGIACLVCQGTVLNRGNDIDKYIVLEKKPSQNLITLHASAQAQVTGKNRLAKITFTKFIILLIQKCTSSLNCSKLKTQNSKKKKQRLKKRGTRDALIKIVIIFLKIDLQLNSMFNSSGKFTIFFGQAHNEKFSLTFFFKADNL